MAEAISAVEPFVSKKRFGALDATQSQHAAALADLERYRILLLDEQADPASLLRKLQADPAVESVSINRLHSLPHSKVQGLLEGEDEDELFAGQWAIEQTKFPEAWRLASGDGIVIGVVDTGVDFLHPDLLNQLWINEPEDLNGNGRFEPWPHDESNEEGLRGDLNGIDEDGNGFADDVIGYDLVDQSIRNFGDDRVRDANPSDEHGHGTNVSGVIAAERYNGIGIAGAAFNSKIMAIRAFDVTGNAEDDDMAAGIVYGALAGADILNLSFGDIFYSPLLRDAIRFATDLGCIVVASSGNSGGSASHYPSNFSAAIGVGATTPSDRLAIFSVSGSLVDLVAPGVNVATTEMGGGFEEVSGTSFAAPLVSAAAALLLELDATLTPADIRGILMETSDDLGDKGWDTEFGAGRLNALQAVSNLGATNISISFPRNDESFKLGKVPSLPVLGSAATPLFKNFDLAIGRSRDPVNWTVIEDSRERQLLRDTLGHIDLANLVPGEYTLRLRVALTNGQSQEKRAIISLVDEDLQASFEIVPAWFNDRRVAVVTGLSSRRSNFSLRYRAAESSDEWQELSAVQRYTQTHHLVLQSDAADVERFLGEVIFSSFDGDTVRSAFELDLAREAMPQRGFLRKEQSLGPSYLLNEVRDLYGEASEVFAVNDIASGDFGQIKTYRFNAGRFEALDSLDELWIPRGFGDSNGDGIVELFAQSGGNSVLFQAGSPGGNPFERRLLERIDNSQFWASTMADMTGDERPELLARSASAYLLYEFRSGEYVLIDSAANVSPPDAEGINLFGPPLSAVGDFDNDGNIELCFADQDADLMIYELRDRRFVLEELLTFEGSNGSQFVTACDADGDGVPEIAFGFHSLIEPNLQREYEPPLWTFKLLQSDGHDSYRAVWEDQIYGVRATSGFRNGIAAGELDERAGEELVITAFPNLYVFRWDNATETLIPMWYDPSALSNTAMIFDFDANGVNELAFGSISGVEFVEFEAAARRPQTPPAFEGWALSATEAYLQWQATPDAEEYAVFKILENEEGELEATLLGSTTEPNYTVSMLEPEELHFFGMTAVNNSMPDNQSAGSPIIEVYTHELIQPLEATAIGAHSVQVQFTGAVGTDAVPPAVFRIAGVGSPSTVISAGADAVLLRFLRPLPAGEHLLEVASFRDFYHSPTIAAELNLRIDEVSDVEELYLKRLQVLSSASIRLEYSLPVEAQSAALTSNYLLRPLGQVARVEIDANDPAAVVLFISDETPLGALGKDYTVTALKVRAASGVRMTGGAGNTLGFTFAASSLSEVFAYPNPVRLAEDKSIIFANLTEDATVTVRTLEGRILAVLTETDGNGGVEWDCRDLQGDLIESGVYLFLVEGRDATGTRFESSMKKFVVQR